jgi:hypothetical protein
MNHVGKQKILMVQIRKCESKSCMFEFDFLILTN